MIHYCKGEYCRDTVPVDPTTSGFRHGTGFFETIAYNGRVICHLERHLDRIHHSMRAYNLDYASVDFKEIILQLLNRNGLEGQFARANIVYPAEEPQAHPVITVAPFEPKPYKAYRLALCSDHQVSPLNAHKNTSYMFFNLALRQAKASGFDDAALFDLDGALLEATTGAIVLHREGEYVMMDSPYRLPSTALELAGQVLDIVPGVVTRDEFSQYRNAYLLNSLVGMRPVVAIGETAFVPDEEACREATELILLDEV